MARILTESQRTDMMAQGVRDLFAASWFGEQMFAQLGLHRAVSVLDDPSDRTKVIGASWRSERLFGRVIELGLAGCALLDMVRAIRHRRWFDAAASGCALGAVGTAIGNEIAGRAIDRAEEHGTPIHDAFHAHERTPKRAQGAQTVLKVLAPLGLALAASSIGLSIVSRSLDD